MKKQLLASIIGITTVVSTIQSQPHYAQLQEIYNHEMEQLQKQLEKTNLFPHEKRSLIQKLTYYFAPDQKQIPTLNNKKVEVLYSSIINSYLKLLKDQQEIDGTHENLAKKFQEQALGKIILYKNPLRIKINKNYLYP